MSFRFCCVNVNPLPAGYPNVKIVRRPSYPRDKRIVYDVDQTTQRFSIVFSKNYDRGHANRLPCAVAEDLKIFLPASKIDGTHGPLNSHLTFPMQLTFPPASILPDGSPDGSIGNLGFRALLFNDGNLFDDFPSSQHMDANCRPGTIYDMNLYCLQTGNQYGVRVTRNIDRVSVAHNRVFSDYDINFI